MPSLESGEPFGLPKGTVRGIIALAFTGTFIQQVIIGAIGSDVFLGVAVGVIGSYFATRGTSENNIPGPLPVQEADPVLPPAVAGDGGD